MGALKSRTRKPKVVAEGVEKSSGVNGNAERLVARRFCLMCSIYKADRKSQARGLRGCGLVAASQFIIALFTWRRADKPTSGRADGATTTLSVEMSKVKRSEW